MVGNGSFGVVFQTKLTPLGEDAANKRVFGTSDMERRVQCHSHLNGGFQGMQ